mgnify:CR=1 FL=1
MSALKVELVAADRKVWEGEASMVSARSIDGELGILPGHTPLLGVLVTGDVRIATGGGDETSHSIVIPRHGFAGAGGPLFQLTITL